MLEKLYKAQPMTRAVLDRSHSKSKMRDTALQRGENGAISGALRTTMDGVVDPLLTTVTDNDEKAAVKNQEKANAFETA